MIRKYIARAGSSPASSAPTGSWFAVEAGWSLAKTVYDADTSPVDTKLVDAGGIKIYRVNEPREVGFLAKWEAEE